MIIGIIATIVIIVGGVFLMSKDSGSTSTPTKVSDNLLVTDSSYKTSGVVNGNYLEASSSAKLTITEFGDFECPACGQYHPLVKQLLTDFSGKINFVFRNFPLTQHKNAQIASQAAEAAGLQGKYWQMHDKLYESQSDWETASDAKGVFISYAEKLGVDVNKFKIDIDSSAIKNKIQSDTNDGNLAKVDATPTYYINGVKIEDLPGSYAEFKDLITEQLNK